MYDEQKQTKLILIIILLIYTKANYFLNRKFWSYFYSTLYFGVNWINMLKTKSKFFMHFRFKPPF